MGSFANDNATSSQMNEHPDLPTLRNLPTDPDSPKLRNLRTAPLSLRVICGP